MFPATTLKYVLLFIYALYREAEATRNALHGVNWPIGNGKKLIIDYGTLEDLETARNPPSKPPEISSTTEKENQVRMLFVCDL